MRAHVARAVALGPKLLVLEHPTATLPEPSRAAFGADIVAVADARTLATLVITEDREWAGLVAKRVLVLNGATGELAPLRKRWFPI